MKGDGLAAIFLHFDDLFGRHVQFASQLFRRGLATEVLQHLALHTSELVDDFDHVHGDTNRASLVGHGARDRLPDPPGGVGRELEALGVVELLDSTNQTKVSLLNEVQELHSSTGVALRQRHHKAQVCSQ